MQHHRAQATRTIPVSADTVWQTIAKTSGMEDWYPQLISKSAVTSADGVTRRDCTMTNGGQLKERILVNDGTTRTFVYAIDSHPLPARNVVGTIRVDAVGDSAHVTWDSQFTVDSAAAQETVAMINGMYETGLASLETHHTRA